MRPTTLWAAIMLLALGVFGILDAAGIVSSSQTIGLWWPTAIIGWAASEMLAARRMTLGGCVCALFGLALLADVQAWAADAVVWSLLAIVAGLAILVDARRHGPERGNENASTPLTGGVS